MTTTPAGSAETNLPQTGPSAFDDHRPPDRDLLDDCVHCGFCLPTCPTYQLWGEEMDSPRGRIYLMNLAEKGEIGLDGPFTEHIDACLGCMACVTACPSGVQYDKLLESVRPQIERNVTRTPADRAFREAIFALFPYKRRLRVAALPGALYQKLRMVPAVRRLAAKLPGRLGALESLLPPVSLREAFARLPERTPAVGARRATVALLTGCVQDVFFHRVNEATVRVLAAEGCDVLAPRDQQCCGALELHAGREDDALRRARRTIARFEALHGDGTDVDHIVTNVAGCGSSMKEYGHLLDDDPEWAPRAKAFSAKVRDIHEVLDALGPRAPRHPVRARVAYHDACHLGHAQGVRAQPRAVLRTIPELEVVDIPEAALCCGSAGIYNMVAPEPAAELGARKAANIRAVQPDVVVTANPGCLLQIGKHLAAPAPAGAATAGLADSRGVRRSRAGASPDGSVADGRAQNGSRPDRAGLPLLHPVQLLDASIRGVPIPRT
jgi:glycolate oxidase iron-sulfur subunit